jgi:flagellar basal body-associated protein FliL
MANFETANGKGRNKQALILSLLILLFLISAASAGYFFWKFRQTQKQLVVLSSVEGQKEIAKKDTDELLAKLKKLMIVPENEDPVVATVTDRDALAKDQPFYANASNGDRVIAFLKNRKAIIYNPAKNIIVNVGPIFGETEAGNAATSTGNQPAEEQPAAAQQQQPPAPTGTTSAQ